MGIETETFSASVCTGSSGATNRVLTISNIYETSDDSLIVTIDGTVSVLTTDFTINHNSSSSTITFLNALFNTSTIIVQYKQGFMQTLTNQSENLRGSSATGIDGASNRVITLANTLTTSDSALLVVVNGLVLIPDTDFTIDHNVASSTITFLNPLYDDAYVFVQYGEGFVEIVSGYCTASDVRLLTNLTTTDISNSDMISIIAQATTQLNQDINVYVHREFVSYIDQTRDNLINGSNTNFYVRNWKGKFLADRNNDGSVTTSDIIVYQVDSDGNETTPTISSIDDDDCKITLTTAPTSNNRYYIEYAYSSVREGTVDPRVRLATIFLASAYGYAKTTIGCAPNVSFGSTRVTKDMNSFSHYYQRYLDIISQINSLEEVHSKVSEDTF